MKDRFLALPAALALAASALLPCPAAYAGEDPGAAPADISVQCPESGTSVIADPDDGHGFYQCIDGTAYKKKCLYADGIFDPETQTCKDAPITAQCPTTGGLKIANSDDRHVYYECYDGTAYKRTCPNSLVFDPETLACEFG